MTTLISELHDNCVESTISLQPSKKTIRHWSFYCEYFHLVLHFNKFFKRIWYHNGSLFVLHSPRIPIFCFRRDLFYFFLPFSENFQCFIWVLSQTRKTPVVRVGVSHCWAINHYVLDRLFCLFCKFSEPAAAVCFIQKSSLALKPLTSG